MAATTKTEINTLHCCPECGEMFRLQEELRPLTEVPGTCAGCLKETVYLRSGSYLPMWKVFESPCDYPQKFVARLYVNERVTQRVMVADTLAELQARKPLRLGRLEPVPGSERNELEIWV